MSVRLHGTWRLALVASLATACAHRVPSQHAQLAFASLPRIPITYATGETEAIEEPSDPTATPAFRYAQLDGDACLAELGKRGIAYARVPEARGVLAPVRLAGPVGGVVFHTGLPPSKRTSSPNEVLDCRLVLALDDFASILRAHDVVEVIHMSGWRPPGKRWPAGKLGTRHDGALALDAGWFVKSDGTKLDVEKDFHGHIGARTCGPGTGPSPATPAAIELRAIVCEAAGAHLFQVALTPDYNWPHRNHFHLEVTPRVRWFLVH